MGEHTAAADLVTVRDVLALPMLREASVVAGSRGLDRVVTGVNIIEVPDVWTWLLGGEFLLSAAYPWRDAPEALVQLMTKLDQCGVSGLGFKLGAYLKALPPPVLEAADELGLPVVSLPPTLAYRDVVEPLYARLLPRAGHAPSPGTHEAFLRYGLDDQSVEKIAGALAREVQSTVRVVDLVDEELYVAPPSGITLRRSFEELGESNQAFVQALVEHKLRRQILTVETPLGPALAAALVVGRRRHGYILLLDVDAADESVTQALSHAAELVSFLLLKRLAYLEGRRQASTLFLGSLWSDELTNEEAAERAITLGIRLTRPCVTVVVGLPNGCPQADWGHVRRQMERGLDPHPHLIAEAGAEGQVHALVQLDDASGPVLGLLTGRLRDALPASLGVVVAAGSARTGLEGVRRSRSEALIAYEAATRCRRQGLVRFEDLGAERVLAQIPLGPVASDYIVSTLGGIEGAEDLVRTLEAYLQHAGNKVATARALHLHRSSLTYRLDKISRLLGVDLDDAERGHELWLALRLRRILRSDLAHRS